MEHAEHKALDLAIARLHRRFPSVPVATIRAEVERAYHHYEGSRVRMHLPILVEREVVEHFEHRVPS
jgi:hypothetical protein